MGSQKFFYVRASVNFSLSLKCTESLLFSTDFMQKSWVSKSSINSCKVQHNFSRSENFLQAHDNISTFSCNFFGKKKEERRLNRTMYNLLNELVIEFWSFQTLVFLVFLNR